VNPHDQVTDEAITHLAESVGDLAGKVENLPARLGKLEKNKNRVGLALILLALAVAGIALYIVISHGTHDTRVARLETQNTAFRKGMCAQAGNWRTYLAATPPGNPARRAAATRIEAGFRALCNP
jgi:hypothetical protein